MEHLNRDTLARLVDETPDRSEAEHLEACADCCAELRALEAQTEALAGLPELVPPRGDWQVLEARLRTEGLVRTGTYEGSAGGTAARSGLAFTPHWMKVAAAILLFLGGTGAGATLTTLGPLAGAGGMRAGQPVASRFAGNDGPTALTSAADRVRQAEEQYVRALSEYRQLMDSEGMEQAGGDPSSRFAALEYLVRAGQAAVRQAPADPFLNGLLASTLAERDATMRTISARQDAWF